MACGVWRTREPALNSRHCERRFALSAEYGVKAVYAQAIDAATGATFGHDQPTLRLVAYGDPATLRALEPSIRAARSGPDRRRP